MKTFTLRLTDMEAEALERLARVNALSKNKQLEELIAEAYKEIDGGLNFPGIPELIEIARDDMDFLESLIARVEDDDMVDFRLSKLMKLDMDDIEAMKEAVKELQIEELHRSMKAERQLIVQTLRQLEYIASNEPDEETQRRLEEIREIIRDCL